MSKYSFDPILRVERGIRQSPLYEGSTQSHILSWAKAIKSQCTSDPKQRAAVALCLSHYASICLIDQILIALMPDDPRAVNLSNIRTRESSSFLKSLRAAGLKHTLKNEKEPEEDRVFTPARNTKKAEVAREHVA